MSIVDRYRDLKIPNYVLRIAKIGGTSCIKRKAYSSSNSEADDLFNHKRQKDAEESDLEVESSPEDSAPEEGNLEELEEEREVSHEEEDDEELHEIAEEERGDDLINCKRQKDAEEGDLEVESSPEDSAPEEEGNSEEREEFNEEDEDEDEDEEDEDEDEDEDEESQGTAEDEESQEIAEEERGDVDSSFSESTLNVKIGQMSIPSDRLELYTRLTNNFGEIVSPNLPKYKLGLTNTALTDLLNAVGEIIAMTPDVISKEKVLEWEDMVSFYNGMGLKVNWLLVRVKRYNDWLVRRSKVDVNQMEGNVMAKRKALEAKRKEVCTLENELNDLCAELETEHNAQSHFNFSFFDN